MSDVASPGPDEASSLDELQDALRGVEALPVAERVDVFEQVNDGIARELARLDEV